MREVRWQELTKDECSACWPLCLATLGEPLERPGFGVGLRLVPDLTQQEFDTFLGLVEDKSVAIGGVVLPVSR